MNRQQDLESVAKNMCGKEKKSFVHMFIFFLQVILGRLAFFGAATLVLWAVWVPLLAPVWGGMLERQFQSSMELEKLRAAVGIAISPILESLRASDWSQQFSSGALLGFYRFNLGLAILLAGWCSLWPWTWRVKNKAVCKLSDAGALLLSFFAWPLFWSINGQIFFCLYGVGVLWLSSKALCWAFDGVSLRLAQNPKKNRYLLRASIYLLFATAGIWTHPLWPVLANPKAYEDEILEDKFQNDDKLTLVRDWLLLDSAGESFFSNWYYSATVATAEWTKTTLFRPTVIGTYKLKPKDWLPQLSYGFYYTQGDSSARLRWKEIPDLELAKSWLEKDILDFIYLESSSLSIETLKNLKLPKNRYAILSPLPLSEEQKKSGLPFYTRYNINNPLPDSYESMSPLWAYVYPRINKEAACKATQFGISQSGALLRMIFKTPLVRVLFLLMVLGGSCFYASRLVAFLMTFSPLRPALMGLALMSGAWTLPALAQNYLTWSGLSARSLNQKVDARNQLRLYRKLGNRAKVLRWNNSLNPIALKLKELNDSVMQACEHILEKGFSGDTRVAIWQMHLLAYAHASMKTDQKLLETEKLILDFYTNNYKQLPIVAQYKLISAMAMMPRLWPELNKLAHKEKHLYNLYYLADRGFYPSAAIINWSEMKTALEPER